MQTDRQDLDKRHIELKCIEPHVTFPGCDGSLKLTEYGYKIEYENVIACADLIKTCTIIEKETSLRPEAGDVGGEPDDPIPDLNTFDCLSNEYNFGKTTQLSSSRLLIVYYDQNDYKRGAIRLVLLDISVVGYPSVVSDIEVEYPVGTSHYCYEDIDVFALDSSTFVLACFTTTYNKSVILNGSITADVISIDGLLKELDDSRLLQSTFAKLGDSVDGFFLSYNITAPGASSTSSSMYYVAFTYSIGSGFAQLGAGNISNNVYLSDVTVPPDYDPTDCFIYKWQAGSIHQRQKIGFSMDFLSEEDSYYLFVGGYTQSHLWNGTDIISAVAFCLIPPPKIYQSIASLVSVRIYKSGGASSALSPYRLKAVIDGSYFKCKRISNNRAIIMYHTFSFVGTSNKVTVLSFTTFGANIQVRKHFNIPADSGHPAIHANSLNEESFVIAVGDSTTKVYPCIWKLDNSYFGYITDFYMADLVSGVTPINIFGQALLDGRVVVISTRIPGFVAVMCVIEPSYV